MIDRQCADCGAEKGLLMTCVDCWRTLCTDCMGGMGQQCEGCENGEDEEWEDE